MKNTQNTQIEKTEPITHQMASKNQLKNIFSFLSPANPKLIVDEFELSSD